MATIRSLLLALVACSTLTACSPICLSRTKILLPVGMADASAIEVTAAACPVGRFGCRQGNVRLRYRGREVIADVSYLDYDLESGVSVWLDVDGDGTRNTGDLRGGTASLTHLRSSTRTETPTIVLERYEAPSPCAAKRAPAE